MFGADQLLYLICSQIGGFKLHMNRVTIITRMVILHLIKTCVTIVKEYLISSTINRI